MAKAAGYPGEYPAEALSSTSSSEYKAAEKEFQEAMSAIDKYELSPQSEKIIGIVAGVIAGAITAFFLHFMYQIKRSCSQVNKTARQLAEILLWFELVLCVSTVAWYAYKLMAH